MGCNRMLKFRRSLKNSCFLVTIIFLVVVFLFSSVSVSAEEATGDDYDSDGLNDIYEEYLGSDYTDSSDVLSFSISDSTYYLVDVAKDGIYDNFCSPLNGYYSDVVYESGIAYLDSDGDGKSDYKYQNGELLEHSTAINFGFADFLNNLNFFESIWFYVTIILAAIAVSILVLFKTGIIYIYEVEYTVEK